MQSGGVHRLANTSLSEGQRDAVFEGLTGAGRFVGVQGSAGTGKTYMLEKLVSYAEKAGYQVEGLAPSHKAREALAEVIKDPTTTQHRFTKIDTQGAGPARSKTILVVDEASMISTADMQKLLSHANEAKYARVILVGDEQQLDAVAAGTPFGQLQRAGMRTALMTDILRQKDGSDAKAAVLNAIKGEVKAAMAKIGRVAETDNISAKLAKDWTALPSDERAKTGIVVQTNALRQSVNDRIRIELKKEGTIDTQGRDLATLSPLNMTRAQAADARNYDRGMLIIPTRSIKSARIEARATYEVIKTREETNRLDVMDRATGEVKTLSLKQGAKLAGSLVGYVETRTEVAVGDAIRFRINDKDNGVLNGTDATVLSVSRRDVKVETADGPLTIPTNSMAAKGIDHAYAMTAHAFQGQTVDNILIGMAASERLANQKQFYVSISRVSEQATLITDDAEKLSQKIQQNSGVRAPALTAYNDARQREMLDAQKEAEKANSEPPEMTREERRAAMREERLEQFKKDATENDKFRDVETLRIIEELQKQMQRQRGGPTL